MTSPVATDHVEAETPVTAEARIDHCIRAIRQAPNVIRDRLSVYQKAKHEYDLKMARVAGDTEGSENARKRAATLACEVERTAMDDAYEALQYAKERARAFEKELSGLQTVNKSVTNAYNTAGWQR